MAANILFVHSSLGGKFMTREEVIAKMIEYAAMAFNVDASKINENTDIAKQLVI